MASALSPLHQVTTSDEVAPAGAAASASGDAAPAADATTALNDTSISSPHELTDWVDSVLDQLESRFSTMSGQVENRMKEMAERIDALESSIEDLITGSTAPVAAAPRESDGLAPSGPQVRVIETATL